MRVSQSRMPEKESNLESFFHYQIAAQLLELFIRV